MVCYATGDRPEEKPFDPGLALVAEHNKVTPGFRRSIENLLLDISTLSELGWYVGCRPAQGTHGILQRGLHRVLFLLPDHIQMLANILAVHVHHWHHADHRDFRHVVQRQGGAEGGRLPCRLGVVVRDKNTLWLWLCVGPRLHGQFWRCFLHDEHRTAGVF